MKKVTTIDKQLYELAEIDYINGMKYKEIADKYNVSINTVKSWKTRYKWSKDGAKGVHTKSEKVCTQKSNNVSKNNTEKELVSEAVKEVMENDDINDKHKQFCILYSKRQNATKAYQKVYHCTYWTAAVEGNKLLKSLR